MTIYRNIVSIMLLLCTSACAAVEPQVEPTRASTSSSEQVISDTAAGSDWPVAAREILMNALSLTGIKYKYGGNSPETGFDCSGFVRYVFQQAASLTLPHNSRAISQLGEAIPLDQLQPGDLVFFNTLKSAFSHVGIYLGDNRFIHAPSSGGAIDVVNMNDRYWSQRFNGARRMATGEGLSAQR